MALFRMSADNVRKRADAILKAHEPKLSLSTVIRLQNLGRMASLSEQYGSQENVLGHDAMVWIDAEDAVALEFF